MICRSDDAALFVVVDQVYGWLKSKEGKLPKGDYREYTVETTGASNLGGRRIVQDADSGRTYYTDDHYGNFVQIDPKKR